MEAIEAILASDEITEWRGFAARCIDEYASLAAGEPGFRNVRFGSAVGAGSFEARRTNNEELGEELDAILVDRYGFAATEELFFATQLAMECADAVTRRAFVHNPSGDIRFIDAAKRMMVAILAPHAPDSYGQHFAP